MTAALKITRSLGLNYIIAAAFVLMLSGVFTSGEQFAVYLNNSAILLLSVGTISLLIAVPSAWLLTFYNLPFKRLFNILMILPFAIPAYIFAIIYGNLFDPAGALSALVPGGIRTLGGLSVILSLAFYPYIFLAAKASFINGSNCYIESARMLGKNNFDIFVNLALPVSRPLIFAGLALVFMETIGEFGASYLFGVATLPTGIYTTWFGLNDFYGALKISLAIFAFVVFFVYVQTQSQRKVKTHNTSGLYHPVTMFEISGLKKYAALFFLSLVAILAFILPVGMLCYWSFSFAGAETLDIGIIGNSFMLASLTAVLTLCIGVVLMNICRSTKNNFICDAIKISSLTYAIPGIVLGFLLMLVFNAFDQVVGTQILTNSIFATVLACAFRFFTISYNKMNGAISGVSRSIDESAYMLGKKPLGILRNIHLPMLRPALFASFMVVFIDTLKELPVTYILRPFNFDTVAIKTFELASDERIYSAAANALLLVILGLIPVLYLNNKFSSSRANGQ